MRCLFAGCFNADRLESASFVGLLLPRWESNSLVARCDVGACLGPRDLAFAFCKLARTRAEPTGWAGTRNELAAGVVLVQLVLVLQ